MNIDVYKQNSTNTYKVCVLIKEKDYEPSVIYENYIKPLESSGLSKDDVVIASLLYDKNNKAGVKVIRPYIKDVLAPALSILQVEFILCADSIYFKELTGRKKVAGSSGYAIDCVTDKLTGCKVIQSANYRGIQFNPMTEETLRTSLEVLSACLAGTYTDPGKGIIHSSSYPKALSAIKEALLDLHQYPALTCDIEHTSLNIVKHGIGTIGFAWDKHNGIAFPVDNLWDLYMDNQQDAVRALLKEFFDTYQGCIIYHNPNFDVKFIIRTLYMKTDVDYAGMHEGLKGMFNDFEDTKSLIYLATNNAVRNKLDLKSNAQEFTGNYAQEDIENILLIPLPDLLEYNLKDCLATWHVRDKYMPKVIADDQHKLYTEVLKPSIVSVTQMELTGFVLDWDAVKEARKELSSLLEGYTKDLEQFKVVQDFNTAHRVKLLLAINDKLVNKVHTPDKVAHECFNPNSNQQVATLLHEFMWLPIIDTTDKGAPSVGSKTIAKHIAAIAVANGLTADEIKTPELLDASCLSEDDKTAVRLIRTLIGINQASIILHTFIDMFLERGHKCSDGEYRLFGNFNTTGTKSLRMSSSNPNLQNLPSGSKYGKLVKKCFKAPKGYIMVGVDYSALEDKVSALVTRDPMKLQVYTDGYDSHSMRALKYFPDEVPLVQNKLALVTPRSKYFKVIDADGTVTYCHESELD